MARTYSRTAIWTTTCKRFLLSAAHRGPPTAFPPTLSSAFLRRRLSSRSNSPSPSPSPSSSYSSSSSSSANTTSVFLFAAPITLTFSLGVWQLHRLRRKNTLIAQRNHRLQQPPIHLDFLFDHQNSPHTDHRRVHLSGHFLHEHEILVAPRSAPKDIPIPVLQWGGSTGLQVYTPLQTTDGRIVLVNRGWIPQRIASPSRRITAAVSPFSFLTKDSSPAKLQKYHLPDNSVSFEGVVTTSQHRNRFTPDNVPAKNHWFYVDPPTMLQSRNLEGCHQVVELVEPYPQSGWPYPRGIHLYADFRTPPSTHVTYAITWFSLSACIALLSRFRTRPFRL